MQNAFIPLEAKDLTKEYSICKILLLLDFFLKYNQVPFNLYSKNITTFSMLIKLL